MFVESMAGRFVDLEIQPVYNLAINSSLCSLPLASDVIS